MLRRMRQHYPNTQIILLVAELSHETASAAVREATQAECRADRAMRLRSPESGADDFLMK